MRLQKAVTTTTCSEKALSRERASWRMSVSAMRILAHCSSLQGRGEGRGGEGRGGEGRGGEGRGGQGRGGQGRGGEGRGGEIHII